MGMPESPGTLRRGRTVVTGLTAGVLLVTALAGCTVEVAGTAADYQAGSGAPGPGDTGSANSDVPTVPSEPSSVGESAPAGGDVAALDPCALVTMEDLSGFGEAEPGERVDDELAASCEFTGSEETWAVAVMVYPDEGVDLDKGQPIDMNGRQATGTSYETEGSRLIKVDMAITDTSHAGVQYFGSADHLDEKTAAVELLYVADMVESRLPG